jgi:hypothetical protein
MYVSEFADFFSNIYLKFPLVKLVSVARIVNKHISEQNMCKPRITGFEHFVRRPEL